VFAEELFALPQPWKNSHYGSCYSSLNSGMSDTYGTDFADDENILQFPRSVGSRKLIIASDSTSGTNSQRTVFERRGPRKWCVVLSSPPVADLAPGAVSASLQRPTTWTSVTQAPPGLPETKVTYRWDSKDQVYKPVTCYKGSVQHWTSFDCNEAYQ
jgi:hypothetical protein